MATTLNRLAPRKVETAAPGFHSDGGNLYLRVRDSNSRAWVFRYKAAGKVREIGLGPLHTRSLAEARQVAEAMRKAVAAGADPADVIRAQPEPEEQTKTFEHCALDMIDAKRAGWKNAKHAQQWANTLRDYAFPAIGKKLPADVTLADIKAVLLPIWATKTETAQRLRGRIEAVLDYAAVHGLCDGTRNPARWKGTLDKVLPAPRKVTAREHHAAAEYADVPRIMAVLAGKAHISALNLRFTILTGARSGEARGALWDEIDLDAATWTIPARRMKAARPHRVPLSAPAVAILKALLPLRRPGVDLVFPGGRDGLLSDVAVNKTLHAIAPGVTVHGFRSAFRTWCEEQTSYPRSVTEAALAHVNADKVEAAYQRSDLFDRRRELMRAWADFTTGKGNIVRLTSAA
ncbi:MULTISPECIES: site-specific integrase [unclassified Thiomonas]|uniref:tyrosine-type recombinase/integrase n=1 Tax=unclassified Thiomonas TaxID=2625466 RepID=UPI0004DBAA4E|nr:MULTISPECIES: site-specific integrase [unclassified Thiomonas]CDW92227.1 Phage integrase family protein [Thiomonas sp. CB2]VDY06617.1 Integrase [Thiomonas sp. Bio17B3]VDY10087.1 Integrase [Thiomonas sp. Sup16B3]VDY14889.1 Phage integrase family protein [Thiomonas sp. OC7]VDY15932.1 Phage integrase family protein [Thiomonas sp. CB2]